MQLIPCVPIPQVRSSRKAFPGCFQKILISRERPVKGGGGGRGAWAQLEFTNAFLEPLLLQFPSEKVTVIVHWNT